MYAYMFVSKCNVRIYVFITYFRVIKLFYHWRKHVSHLKIEKLKYAHKIYIVKIADMGYLCMF